MNSKRKGYSVLKLFKSKLQKNFCVQCNRISLEYELICIKL